MAPQEHAFRSGVDLIVATPGRLLDHLRHDYAKLDHIEFLVLDEADRMLDMGFLPDVRRILNKLPAKRQTMFFSATMPAPIVSLTRQMLKDPVTINLQRVSTPPSAITQAVYPVVQDRKGELLLALLQREIIKDALVFTRTAPTGCTSSWPGTAFRSSGSTATGRSRSAPRRWPASRAASTGSWWRPTSPPAASTSRSWGTW